MTGERSLARILEGLEPSLSGTEYVFLTFPETPVSELANLDPWGVVREDEGVTLILARDVADRRKLRYEAVFRRVTLRIHSSLEAVGLTAVVARRLADEGISANVVAAYHHDHVFVPAVDAERALHALGDLQRDSNAT